MDASVLCALLLFATAAVTAGSVHDFIIIIVQVNNNWSLFCFSITRSEAGRVHSPLRVPQIDSKTFRRQNRPPDGKNRLHSAQQVFVMRQQ